MSLEKLNNATMNVIAQHKDCATFAIGDIHGEFKLLRDKINLYRIENSLGFVCGDFGVGFNYNDPREPKKENKRLQELNTFLKKRNIFLYVVRGNHDNPSFYDGNHNFSNLIFMQDYDVVEVGDFTYIGIGGATSVDRKSNYHFKDQRGHDYPGRKEGVNWWPNEKVVYDEEELNLIAGVDVVIAHICPDFVYPPVLGGTVLKWMDCDPELKDELVTERELMGKIYNKLSELSVIKQFIYAHFHQSHHEIYNNTKFKLLDIGEIHDIRLKNID